MSRNALVLASLFVASYFSLLWLTSVKHRNDVPVAAGPSAPASKETEMQVAETPDPPPSVNSQSEIVTAELSPQVQAEEPDEPDPELVVDSEIQMTQQDGVEAAPQTIEAATKALRSGADRDTRLLAAKSLLLMGRKSIVDPAITQALREALSDSDKVVAAQANSALVEVERATH